MLLSPYRSVVSLQMRAARVPIQPARYSEMRKTPVKLLMCLKPGVCFTTVLNWALLSFIFCCDNSVLILPVTKVNVYYLFSAIIIPYITSALQF